MKKKLYYQLHGRFNPLDLMSAFRRERLFYVNNIKTIYTMENIVCNDFKAFHFD